MGVVFILNENPYKQVISKEVLEKIFHLFPNPSYIWKKIEDDFILIDYNKAAEHITNGKIKNIIGIKASELHKNYPDILLDLDHCSNNKRRISREMNYSFKTTVKEKILHITYDWISPNLVLVHTEDISERKKAELKLKESEERFRIIIDKAVPAFAINDLKGNILMVNDLAVEMLGYSKEELMQMNITNIALEIIPLEHIKKYWEDMAIGEHIETTGMHKRKDGSVFPAEEKLIKLKFKNKPVIAAFVRDLSKHIKKEQELKGSEELYQLISENVNDIISIINSDTIFTYCNEAFKNVLGYTPEELIGTSLFKLVHPEDLNKIHQSYDTLIETGLIKNETRFQSKDGIYKWFESIGKGIFDKDMNLTKLIIIARDITDRKEAEQKLEESEKKYKYLSVELETILDLMPGLVYCKDKNDIVTRVNQTFADSLKLNKEDTIGKTTFDFFPEEQAKKYRNDDLEVIISGKPKLNIVESGDFPDGKKFTITNKVPQYSDKGEIIGIIGLTIDITKQKIAEQKLKESEERFRIIINKAVPAFLINDLEGNILMVNDLMVKLLKYSREELLQMNVKDVAYEVIPMEHKTKYWEKLAIGEHVETTGMHERKDGSIYPAEITLVKIRFKDQPVIAAFVRDISKRKEEEQELKGSEEMYRMISENANDIISILNNEAKFTYCNEAFKNVLGYTPEELIGTSLFKLVHPEDLNNIYQSYDTLIETGLIKNETRFQSKDGIYKWLESIGKGIFDKDMNLTKLIIIARDITDRKEAEQKLEESEKKYRELFEKSPISHWEEDFSKIKKYLDKLKAQGVENLREYLDKNPKEIKKIMSLVKVLDVNKKTLEMFKFDTKEDLINGLDILFTDDAIQIYKEGMIAFSEGETSFEYELIVQTSDNQQINILTIGEIVSGYEKNWSKVLNSLINITDLKKTEQLLKESEENFRHAYERESFYKDLFAHDMSNILQGMLTSLEIYELELNSLESSPIYNNILKIFKDQVNRARSLVRNVRKFSELDQSQIILKEMNFRELIDKAYNIVLNHAKDKKINLKLKYLSNIFIIKANEFLLDVFENLLYNSVKHNKNQEIEILIRSSTIQKKGKRFLKLEFIDNGIGIPDDRKESVLMRGINKDKSVSGIGLGLSLIKKILENYNAEIYIENRISEDYTKGSNFILLFSEVS